MREKALEQLAVAREAGQIYMNALHIWEGLLTLEEKYGPSSLFDDARMYLSNSKKRREDGKTPRSVVIARDEWTKEQIVPPKKILGIPARVPERDEIVLERAKNVIAPETGLSPEFHTKIAAKYIARSIRVQVGAGIPEFTTEPIKKSA